MTTEQIEKIEKELAGGLVDHIFHWFTKGNSEEFGMFEVAVTEGRVGLVLRGSAPIEERRDQFLKLYTGLDNMADKLKLLAKQKDMEWENKVELVKLGNQCHRSDEAAQAFEDYVLENIADFDDQAFSMYLNIIELAPKEIELRPNLHKPMAKVLGRFRSDHFGLRDSIRVGIYIGIVEDLWKEEEQ